MKHSRDYCKYKKVYFKPEFDRCPCCSSLLRRDHVAWRKGIQTLNGCIYATNYAFRCSNFECARLYRSTEADLITLPFRTYSIDVIVDLMMGDTIKIAKVSEGFNKLLSEEIVYGSFSEEGDLASFANTNSVAASAWVISSVQTSEKHRRQGFARVVVSAITRHVVDEAGRAVLFVDTGNEAAQALYRQIGYRVIETSVITGLDIV